MAMGAISPSLYASGGECGLRRTTRHASGRGAPGSPEAFTLVKKGGWREGQRADNKGVQHRVDKRQAAWDLWLIQTEEMELPRGAKAVKSKQVIPILDKIAEMVKAPGGQSRRHRREWLRRTRLDAKTDS